MFLGTRAFRTWFTLKYCIRLVTYTRKPLSCFALVLKNRSLPAIGPAIVAAPLFHACQKVTKQKMLDNIKSSNDNEPNPPRDLNEKPV